MHAFHTSLHNGQRAPVGMCKKRHDSHRGVLANIANVARLEPHGPRPDCAAGGQHECRGYKEACHAAASWRRGAIADTGVHGWRTSHAHRHIHSLVAGAGVAPGVKTVLRCNNFGDDQVGGAAGHRFLVLIGSCSVYGGWGGRAGGRAGHEIEHIEEKTGEDALHSQGVVPLQVRGGTNHKPVECQSGEAKPEGRRHAASRCKWLPQHKQRM